MKRRALILAVLLLTLPAGSATAAARPSSASAQATKRFATLVADTGGLSRKVARRRVRAGLLRTAKAARRARKRKPCTARLLLRSYRGKLGKVHRRKLRARTPTGPSLRGELESDAELGTPAPSAGA